MRIGNQLFAAIQFLIMAALFIVGAAFFGLHFLHGVRLEFANWILQNHDRFLIFGYLVTGIALVLGICFWSMQRSCYLRIKMDGTKSFEIHADLVQARLEKEFAPYPVDVFFSKQKIEIITQANMEDLEAIEEHLCHLLKSEFGYQEEVFLSLKNPELP